MVIGSHKRWIVYNKTDFKCSICGSKKDLECTCFIPEWTRIGDDVDNIIPLCSNCLIKRGVHLIELGKLKYLPRLHVEVLMRFYHANRKYLYKYIRLFGYSRTRGLLDVDNSINTLSSYDLWLESNPECLNWDKLK